MSRRTFLGVVASCVWLSAGAAGSQELSGGGEWRSLSGEAIKGKWHASLVRTRKQLSGTFSVEGSNAFVGGTVEGEIDAESIVLGVMNGGTVQAWFAGKLDGKSIEGEWECEALQDHGVWYGTLEHRVRDQIAK